MPQVENAFFIKGDDGEEYGPVELDELREWVQENRVGLGTVVRLDEPNSLWQPWQYYPELVALLAEAHARDHSPMQEGMVPAPLGRRMLACILDLILSHVLVAPILVVTVLTFASDWYVRFVVAVLRADNVLPEPPFYYELFTSLVLLLGMSFYMAGFHAAHGKTPAKAIMRIRVVDENGQKPSFTQALLRGLILALSIYPFYGIPFAYAFFNPQRRAFHDFIAGTYVVEA